MKDTKHLALFFSTIMPHSVTLILMLAVSKIVFAQQSAAIVMPAGLQSYIQEWQLQPGDLQGASLLDTHTSEHNQVTHAYYVQHHAGIPIVNAIMGIHTLPQGSVLFATSRFWPQAAKRINASVPLVTARKAIVQAATHLGNPIQSFEDISDNTFLAEKLSRNPIKTQLHYQPMPDSTLRLAWRFVIDDVRNSDVWDIRVDAIDGSILAKDNYTLYCSFHEHDETETDLHNDLGASDSMKEANPFICQDQHKHNYFTPLNRTKTAYTPASYRVFPFPVESPLHGPRVLVKNIEDPVASPYGWHDIDGKDGAEFTITRGNNVHAYQDRTGQNESKNDEPNGTSELLFNFPLDFSLEPEDNIPAAVTQLFYANNIAHDIFYQYGFTEAAGNFQHNNYQRGGSNFDAVQAHAQDSAALGARNNAWFDVMQDGIPPRMQMFLWQNSQSSVFNIEKPTSLAGIYTTGFAAFGSNITQTPLTGKAVLYQDTLTSTSLGCIKPANADQLTGAIAFIDRGNCSFSEKALSAAQAGAIACIVCNTEEGVFTMSKKEGIQDVSIPVLMLDKSTCQKIKQALLDSQTVAIRLQRRAEDGASLLDSDLDNGIIIHEYGHGISIRLTGGRNVASCLHNDEQMGEGWSDFFALALTTTDSSLASRTRGLATYSTSQGIDGRGLRRKKYSPLTTQNDFTYDNIVNTTNPHALGEVWATMLWDLYWALVDQYGWSGDIYTGKGGNNMAIQLVMDGLKLQACNPGFIDGRDAILAADKANYKGVNECLIWSVFAKRGLGFGALQQNTTDRTDGTPSFKTPPACDYPISMTKTTDAVVEAGDNITVKLEISNHQSTPAVNIRLQDGIPFNTAFLAGSQKGATLSEYNRNQVVFTIEQIPANSKVTIQYKIATNPANASKIISQNKGENNTNWRNLAGTGQTTWTTSLQRFTSKPASWFIGNNDQVFSRQYLQTVQPVKISGTQPVLRFKHLLFSDSPNDGGFLEFSEDNGTTWKPVKTLFRGDYRGNLALNNSLPKAFWGNFDSFKSSYVDLAEFVGQSLLFRFHYTVDGVQNKVAASPQAGWYIDDIEFIDMLNYESEALLHDANGKELFRVMSAERGTVIDPREKENTALVKEDGISVLAFPNPAEGSDTYIGLSNTGQEREVTLRIFAINGSLLSTRKITLGDGYYIENLGMQHYPAGAYLVRLESGETTQTIRIVRL